MMAVWIPAETPFRGRGNPQKGVTIMLKRFRTSDGKLSCTLAELKEKTMPEAFEYYVPGRLYVYHGKTYILDNLGLP